MAVPQSAVEEGAIKHADPDMLVAYEHGRHPYDSVEEAKEAVAKDELSVVGFEFVLEDLIG